uniref:glutathione transferase n=1 Tax=Leersia perrieri TaxID=77586 RepID=A0A0D9V159_9ORYZ
MAMKVYGLPMSTNVARVLPFGQVPALQDGDLILFESRAISKYVLRKNNSELLKEYNISESAKVDVWLEVESHQFDIPMAVVIYKCLILLVYFGGETDVKVVEENLQKLKKTFQVYEERLSQVQILSWRFRQLG